jgi:hypothetical protein
MRPAQLKIPSDTSPIELRLSKLNGGLNLKLFESLINDNQSPILQNLNSDDRGGLSKRKGWQGYLKTEPGYQDFIDEYGDVDVDTFVADNGDMTIAEIITALSTYDYNHAINGLYFYNNKYVFSENGILYTNSTTEIVELLTLQDDSYMNFYEFNGILYGINGTDFIYYDGSTADYLTPYIPTTVINRPPGGGGDLYEQLNRIGTGFKNSFNGNSSSTTYVLSDSDLDDDTVIIFIGATELEEDNDFTVDRTNGTIDFSSGTSPHGAPITGTNNVIITAFKTYQSSIDSINGNKYMTAYGGENDTRMFLCGNSNFVFYSALLDATYWPYNNFNTIGESSFDCNGFSRFYDLLIVFKSNEIFSMIYTSETDSEGNLLVSFPTKLINGIIGCDCPNSIQIINDYPVWLNSKKGIYILWANGNIKEEKNVRLISENINGAESRIGLLDKTNLNLSSSADHEGKYILCIENECFVWDYNLYMYQGQDDGGKSLSWFYYTNINANCFCINSDNNLVFGDKDNGQLNIFNNNFNDDGAAINAIYRTKLFAFKSGSSELTDYYKTILQFWLSSRSSSGNSISVKYITEKKEIDNGSIIERDGVNFDWGNFCWDKFNWGVSNYIVTINKKPKLKNVKFFQLELSNNEVDEDLSIIYLILQYIITKKIK